MQLNLQGVEGAVAVRGHVIDGTEPWIKAQAGYRIIVFRSGGGVDLNAPDFKIGLTHLCKKKKGH